MNARLFLAAAFAAMFAPPLAVLAAEPAPAAAITAEFVAADAPEAAEIRTLGERAINRLAYLMVSEANSAVAKHGAADALDVCHLKTTPANGAVLADMPRITAWKRTSLKVRDPANAPDAADLLALHRVQADLSADKLPPKLFVQRVQHPGAGTPEWRVYKPVAVLNQCVACHGRADDLSTDARAEIRRRFPADQATGYSAGEWRGLIRVTVGSAPAAPIAPKSPGKISPKKA